MTMWRSILSRIFAALLLLQWGVGPAQALAVDAFRADIDAAICTAPGETAPHAPAHEAPWTDLICLTAHAVDQAALLPPPAVVPIAVTFTVVTMPAAPAAQVALPPLQSPVQPRAPPVSL
jgi:hypothetical protein